MNFVRKGLSIALVMSLVFLVAACGQTASGGDSNGTSPSSGDKLVVGTDSNFLPFEYLNQETGELEGFDIDLWTAIAKEIGVEFEFQAMDFAGLIPALQSGTIDAAIAGMTIKEERKEKVDFARPYYDAGLLVLVRSDNTDIQSVKDLSGKVIATKTGTTSYDYAQAIDGVKEVIPFPDINGAYMELINSGADAVIFDSPNVLYFANTKGKDKVKPVGDILEGQQYGIAFPKGSELVGDVNDALEKLMENGTYEELYVKWFGEKPKSLPKK